MAACNHQYTALIIAVVIVVFVLYYKMLNFMTLHIQSFICKLVVFCSIIAVNLNILFCQVILLLHLYQSQHRDAARIFLANSDLASVYLRQSEPVPGQEKGFVVGLQPAHVKNL